MNDVRCSRFYGSYDTLDDAKSACRADIGCGKIYDNGCNNKSRIFLCKKHAETAQSTRGSCIYVRDTVSTGN